MHLKALKVTNKRQLHYIMDSENLGPGKKFIHLTSKYIPKFTDVFDEESFYIFAISFTILSVIAGFILSRYIKINDVGERHCHKD